MVVEQNMENQTNKQNPLIDTSNVTINAFNAIKNKEKSDKNFILGRDDKDSYTSQNFSVKIKAWTQDDDQTHTYFHSCSIDVNVEDFMGTAELKCPYDSDLMEYWEPIRQTVVIYGANRGDYKILFIGRVRELKQDGYELVITFQNYGWKFKQNVTQSYAKDNVLGKDGYTIMRLMFEALKIDSWVISESAKKRLKEVGMDNDGNLVMNGKEVEKMPDLLTRLQDSDPSKLVSKDTLNDKLREKYLHNIKNINYTLKYEKPTPVMKKIASEGSFTGGQGIYANQYGSSGGGGGGVGESAAVTDAAAKNKAKSGCSINIRSACPRVKSTTIQDHLANIWKYNHGCVNSYADAYAAIKNYAYKYPDAYLYQVTPCLNTIAKSTTRSDRKNGASVVVSNSNSIAYTRKTANSAVKAANSAGQAISYASKGQLGKALGSAGKVVSNAWNSITNGVRSFLGW